MKHFRTVFLSLLLLGWYLNGSGQLPSRFEKTLFSDELPEVTTLEFADNGYVYACDFNGKIWLFIDGELQPEPVIDISEEVAGHAELGCLSFGLHPDFMNNGYIYMLYVVDRHHLLYYGTDDYDPEKDIEEEATIGRIARFQLSTDDYKTLEPGSRKVIFGEEIGEGNPALTISHGTGDLLFGTDGSLIFSTGDGNTFENQFAGGDQEPPATAFDEQALEDGIISEKENVGAFRAQQIHSYSGKVLRIDPMTGEGLPSNPFYDPEVPDAPQSKVWALGMRNPYRMALRPGTGSTDMSAGDPGTIYITDVGDGSWEEINVCDGPGYNFGWPLYEGMGPMWGFYNKERLNRFQPNPIGDECGRPFFNFKELIQQENGDHEYLFPNPCSSLETIEEYADVFYHTRPALAYRNDSWNPGGRAPLLPTFDEDENATEQEITAPESGVEGAIDFGGIAAMTGDFYRGTKFPEEYRGILPVLDYDGWLKVFWFDDNHELTRMEHWLSDLENVIDLRYNPHDECYYAIGLFPPKIERICYSGNLGPVIELEMNPEYGSSPLEVTFDAQATVDPEGDPMEFVWEFGDGETDTGAVVSHEYTAANDQPQSFEPVLTVTDSAGNETSKRRLVSLNNSPPEVEISSVSPGQLYPMDVISELPLEAEVRDAEHDLSDLDYKWVMYLHHNTHFHPLNETDAPTSVFKVNPVGCEEFNDYFYRITLRVKDPQGLEGMDERFIYPDCEGVLTGLSDEFVVYPNPAKDRVRLRFGDAEVEGQEYRVQVFDMDGREVLEGWYSANAIENAVELKLGNLGVGQYLFLATSEQGKEYNGRFLIVRD